MIETKSKIKNNFKNPKVSQAAFFLCQKKIKA